MGDMKKIRVRKAKASDHGLFKKLWMELLQAQNELGSTVISDEQSIEPVMQLFTAIIDGDLDGVVLFVADAGVLMYGDAGNPMHLTVGEKVAYGYGHYVRPDARGKGILDAMITEAVKELRAMDFDVILGSTLEKDTHGLAALERCMKKNDCEVEPTQDRPNFVRIKE
jgi:GNAT superfamily N-acetyltransferase